MKITAVRASWLRARIPPERAHVSDFGRNDSFNTCLVEVETDAGLVGLGEAKVGVGNLGNYAAVVTLIREELAPALVGQDARDITRLWETLYAGTRHHYALREGRTFPTVGRRGIASSPSIEKTPSVAIRRKRLLIDSFSCCSRSAMSEWL